MNQLSDKIESSIPQSLYDTFFIPVAYTATTIRDLRYNPFGSPAQLSSSIS